MRPAVLALLLLSAIAPLAPARADSAPILSNGIEYVSLEDRATRLGLRFEHLGGPPAILLKDGAAPVAKLIDRSRDTDIRGLRVFMGDPVVERGGVFYISRADFADHLLPRLRPELCGIPPRVPHLIVVDAGHGGIDHGTENPRLRTMEKTYTLDVALRLRKLLEAAGYQVKMIREADVTVPKENRSTIANTMGAELFVSIHFNSTYPNTKTAGVEVMSFPARGQRSTDSWSPGRSNDSERGDAPINAYAPWNTILGSLLHRHLLTALHDGDRGEKFEHLAVLRGLDCPGILVEPAFLSSDTEAVSLATPAYRDAIAGALLAGIQDYTDLIRRLHPSVVPGPAPAAAHPATTVPPFSAAPRSVPTRPSGP
jgi:N-acetylmuramoyl-L-alanine amidase